jgi:hypothetical protein
VSSPNVGLIYDVITLGGTESIDLQRLASVRLTALEVGESRYHPELDAISVNSVGSNPVNNEVLTEIGAGAQTCPASSSPWEMPRVRPSVSGS